jgi:hypothetical protein
VRFDLAEPGSPEHKPGFSRIVLVILLSILLLAGCGGQTTKHTKSRAERATAALEQLESAVKTRSDEGLVPDLGYVVTNAEALNIQDFTARWADAISGGTNNFVGSIQVSYRLADHDSNETRLTVAMGFEQHQGRTQLRSIGGHDELTPLWLAGPVQVRTSADAMVIAGEAVPSDDVDLIARMSRRAQRQVQRILPSFENLVVEVPGSVAQMNEVLQAEPGQYDDIAAVATTPDGLLVPGTPVHVFVNPEVFMEMDRLGAQVVLTHEATHVATKAPFADLPAWLREGFADYVALANGRIPVQTAAAQYLREVRRHGLPAQLPPNSDLDPRSESFATAYEAAWLLCRSIADHFGEQRLVDLYEASSEQSNGEVPFEAVLGVTESDVLELWRSDLRDLTGIS